MRYSHIILVVLILAACSGGHSTVPRNLDNACSILKQRTAWRRDLKRTERKWGVPPAVVMSMIYHESKFDSKARTPLVYKMGVIPWGRQSSAYGFSQALDATWDAYRDDTGSRNAKRHKFKDAVDFMGWYMNKTHERNGVSKSDAYNQYLAYHEGHSGYARGSYRRKSWLPPYARRVQKRAHLYSTQLRRCR